MKSFPHRLLTPGPVPLPPWVKEKLALDVLHHRSFEFKEILKRVLTRLKVFFQTEEDVLILNSTGTGAMEAALLNTLSPGDLVLSIFGGRFGERWNQMAKQYGLDVRELKVEYGKALDLNVLREVLMEFKRSETSVQKNKSSLKALLCQASETSTGTLFPIQKISQLLLDIWPLEAESKRDLSSERPLLLVDAMTALGAIHLPMDECLIDVLMTSSQKALMLPPGLSFIGLSKRAWIWNQFSKFKTFYFDLKKEREAQRKGETSFSANVSHVQALDAVLEKVAQDQNSLRQMIQDCEEKSKKTIQFLKSISIEIFSESPSPSVTAFKLPKGISPKEFKKYLKDRYNVSIASGEEGSLRIGHIGYVQLEDLMFCLKAIEESLKYFRSFEKSRSFFQSPRFW